MKNVSLSARALLALLTLVVTTLPAHAVTEERFFLFWQDWEVLGATGSSVVVGQLDGGLPNLDHAAWSGAHIVPIVYPLSVGVTSDEDPEVNRQFFFTSHATAALGAIGARNTTLGDSPLGGIQGFAPQATLLAAGFGDGFDPQTGNISSIRPEAVLFSLMMLADQDFADAAIGDLTTYWQNYVTRHTNPFTGVPDALAAAIHPSFLTQGPYRVATVINLPFSNTTDAIARTGDDIIGQVVNIVAAMTPATFVAAAGNAGDRQDINTLDPPQGSVGSPAGASNVISVGFTESGRNGQVDKNSSHGPSGKRDRRADANLIPADAPTLAPPPTVSPIPEIVSGVTIAAPGVELELPGSFIASPLDNTAFVKGWTGSSMSSSVVAGALAQLHDLHRKRYFLNNPNDPLGEFSPNAILPPVVTRAILYNSANKEQGFRNLSIPSQADNNALVTTKPFDDEVGAGRLNMRRLLNQYLSTPALGGYQDLDGNPNDNDGAEILVLRRDPSILLPNDAALDSANSYTINDINGDPIQFLGTNPNSPSITFFIKPGQDDRGGGLRQTASRSTPAKGNNVFIPTIDVPGESYTDFAQAQLIPPGSLTDFGGDGGGSFGDGSGLNSPSTGNGLTLGEGTVSGGTTTGNVGNTLSESNPSNPIGRLFSSGWDHGNLGIGFLDLPMGLITKGSTISATVSWTETQIFDQRFIDVMRDSVAPVTLPASMQADTRSLMLQATAAGVPVPNPGSAEARALLHPYPTERTIEDFRTDPQQYFEPTVMAGFNVSPINPPPGFDPAQNDDPNDFYNYNTNTGHVDQLSDGTLNPQSSAFRGVCHITAQISTSTLSFTGVAIGPRHILTAAHNFDLNNDGLADENPIRQVTIEFYGIGGDGVKKTYGPSTLAKAVQSHPTYVGIDPISRGFSDDLALITLKDTIDFAVDGVPTYAISTFDQATLPGPAGPPLDIIIVGYGESGFGDIGANSSQFPSNGLVKRIGWNQLKNNFIIGKSQIANAFPNLFQSYRYDFDGPAVIFGEGILNDGTTLGNTRESIHTTGDSGGPAFRWFDSGDGLGGAADGIIQEAELRVFGINTARLSGSAQTIDQFGATGVGVLLNTYANSAEPSWDNWIINTIDAPPPPPLPPIPGNPSVDTSPDGSDTVGLIADLVEWEIENIDLEVYRKAFDGSGNRLVAASRSEFYTNEMVFIQNDENLITLGNYFARIIYTNTLWDFGGFLFNDAPSTAQKNGRNILYKDAFNADIEYGFAYYVDLIRDPNIFGFRSVSTRGVDGSFTATEEPYLKVRYEDLIGDMNADADIDGQDLGALLSLWGKTGIAGQTRGDLNADGIVNSGDLGVLLMHYTGSK